MFNTTNIAVFSMTKIQFWKQFTTSPNSLQTKCGLYSVWQRYNFESNLQRFLNLNLISLRCIQYDKDTILKAIYNTKSRKWLSVSAVFSMTKIQFWKQFTTRPRKWLHCNGLYSVWQRYNFESNLQLLDAVNRKIQSCIQYDKDTILKAIYNQLKRI